MKKDEDDILENFLLELDLPTYPLGCELEKAFISPQAGLPFIRAIFAVPGMADRIFTIGSEIKECVRKYKDNPNDHCVEYLRKKRLAVEKDLLERGISFSWDVFDNLWDKLPGD